MLLGQLADGRFQIDFDTDQLEEHRKLIRGDPQRGYHFIPLVLEEDFDIRRYR